MSTALSSIAATGPPAATAESDLWSRWLESADADARNALLTLHLPYARTVAATYYGRRIHDEIAFDDYLQYARLGMIEAFDRFDPARGAQFRTFAARRMHGAILDGIERSSEKQQQIAVRQRLRKERLSAVKDAAGAGTKPVRARDGDDLFRYLADVGIGLALCSLLEGTGMVDAGEALNRLSAERHYEPIELAQLRRRVIELVDRLGPQQRIVIRYHYLQEHSFEEIADMMAVTRGRISQIHRQALETLRVGLGSGDGCDVAC